MRSGPEFEAVLRSGRRFTSRNFVLRAGPNGLTHARLGIIAGRKAAPRSVDRNRAKRLIREEFRVVYESLGGRDVTIQLRNNLRSESSRGLRSELHTLLETLRRPEASRSQQSCR